MSALGLTRCETAIRRCVATLLHASYTDGIPTETTDAWRTIAADASRDLTALITRLRAAEARTAWQPIETAPPPAEEWLHVAWVGEPGYQYARLDEHGWWVAESGRFYEDAYAETPPTHWCRPQRLTWTGALPAAPEAPHV